MKDILSLCLCQTLLLLVLQNIRICHADDASQSYDLERSYYEKRSRNNRAYGGQTQADEQANAQAYAQANSQFETLTYNQAQAQAEAHAQAQLQNFNNGGINYDQTYAHSEANLLGSTFGGFSSDHHSHFKANGVPDKIGRSKSLRKPLMEYDSAAPGYDGKISSDSSESVEIATVGSSLSDGNTSNINILPDCSKCFANKHNNTLLGDSNNNLVKSSSATATSGAESCACDGGFGASDEVSFLCFSSKDGGESFSIKSKGIKSTNFNHEAIVKAYKFYYDNMQVNNFENNLNNQNTFKHEFDGDNKFNVDVNKFKLNTYNEGIPFLNTENKFDVNEIKQGNNKFNVNNFDLNMNTFKKDLNKFNFDVTENGNQNFDINTHLIENNKFNAQFEQQFNSNFNLDTISMLEALKKINSMKDSHKNTKFNLNNDLNVNHYSFDSNMAAKIEAQAKALAQAKAIAKYQAILQAQAQALAEAKAQAVIQTQINAQAQAEAQAQVMAQLHAQANSQINVQNQVQNQAYIHAHAQAQAQNQLFNGQAQQFGSSTINNNAGPNKFGAGGDKGIYVSGGFNMGYNEAVGLSKFGSFSNPKMLKYSPQTGSAAVSGDVSLAPTAAGGDYYVGNKFDYSDTLQYEDIPNDNFRDYSAVAYPGVIDYPAPSDNPATSPVLW